MLSFGSLLWTSIAAHLVSSQPLAPPPSLRTAEPKKIGTQAPVGTPASSTRFRERTQSGRNILTENAEFYCLDGFNLNPVSERCERDDSRQAELGCPLGWELADGACSTAAVRPADRYCGEDMTERNGRCHRTLIAPKQLMCPPAYLHSESGCVKEVETDPILDCEKGELKRGVCVEVVRTSPLELCEDGFQRVGHQCARKRLLQFSTNCLPGYTLQADDVCSKPIKSSPTPLCRPGGVLRGGLCFAESAVQPFYQCPDQRITAADDHCRQEVIMPSMETCPAGTESLGEVCLLDETRPPVEDCPDHAKSTPHGCFIGKDRVPSSKSCPNGFSFSGKATCRRKSTVPRETTCPSGFALRGSSCVAVDFVPPQLTCPEGAIPQGKSCLHSESYRPKSECPENTTYDAESSSCFGQLLTEALPMCDVGTFDPLERACVLAEVMQPEVMCPPGSLASNASGLPNHCEEIVTRAPRNTCPPDFAFSQTSANCRGTAIVEGELYCAEPYQDSDDHCTFEESAPKIMGCTDGGFLKGTSCVSRQSQPPAVLCPEGYDYTPDLQMCKKLLWSKPVPICRKGFVFDNLVHKCYKFDTPERRPGLPQQPNPLPQEANLPLQVEQPQNPTTTTRSPVKAKVQPPPTSKEQFIPIQTFTGPDAVQQASVMETLKLVNQVNGEPPKQVFVPPL